MHDRSVALLSLLFNHHPFPVFVVIIFKLSHMEDSDTKIKNQLFNAWEQFKSKQYQQCKKLLSEVKLTHISIELNTLLCEYKEAPNNSRKIEAIIKKLTDILITLNIKLYQQRPLELQNKELDTAQKAPKINHEFYYWNIIVLSQLIGNNEVAELLINQAAHFVDSLRTETSLMLIYQMLNLMQGSGRLASCIRLIEKQNLILAHVKRISKQQQTYRFMMQILYNKILLKLGMTQEGKIMYMMKFPQISEDKKQQVDIKEINGIPINIYQQILHAEIEYHVKNYPQAIKYLSEIIPQLDSLGKNKEFIKALLDHNLAVILSNYRQSSSAQVLFKKSLTFISNPKELEGNNQKSSIIARCKQNMILSGLIGRSVNHQGLYDQLKNCGSSFSYKFNFRKAQVCLNLYHQLLKNPQKELPYKDIHDMYETVYFYPNQPYFQQKGKNKNPNYTNSKYYYRRYILSEWQTSDLGNEHAKNYLKEAESQLIGSENGVKQSRQSKIDPKDKKKQKSVPAKNSKSLKKQQDPVKQEPIKEEPKIKLDPYKEKMKQILDQAEFYLENSLVVLERERKVVVNFQGEEKGFTGQVNEKLYNDFVDYKASIYQKLCYIGLCKREWTKAANYAQKYEEFEKNYQMQKKNDFHQKIYYNILTYKMEATCQLNRISNSLQATHELANALNSMNYSESSQLLARSTASQLQGQTYFEQTNHYNNFIFNLAVLHSRDNKIPEAYQSIQKLLQQMRISPTNPQAKIPLSIIELLIHYNLRTTNPTSAVQLIKRRRILNVPGIAHYPATLNITK